MHFNGLAFLLLYYILELKSCNLRGYGLALWGAPIGSRLGPETELNNRLIFVAADFPSDPSGLVTGAAMAIETERRRADGEGQPVQGVLFGVEPVAPDGLGALEDGPDQPRGRGRPAGSRNRSTEEWSRFILTRYRSPLLGLAELAQATPTALQVALGGAPTKDKPDGCSMLEAVKIIMQAQQALAPYLHQKQPTAIDAGGVGMMQVIINTGNGSEGAQAFDIQPIEETEEYQTLSESGVDLSEDGDRSA